MTLRLPAMTKFLSDTGTEGEPSARETDGKVRLDLDNEVHARVFDEASGGVSGDGRIARAIEFVVIDGELWTDDPRIVGG